jgi:hypothetical protein
MLSSFNFFKKNIDFLLKIKILKTQNSDYDEHLISLGCPVRVLKKCSVLQSEKLQYCQVFHIRPVTKMTMGYP